MEAKSHYMAEMWCKPQWMKHILRVLLKEGENETHKGRN